MQILAEKNEQVKQLLQLALSIIFAEILNSNEYLLFGSFIPFKA